MNSTQERNASARLSYAIVFVGDRARAVAFYRDVIGLALRFESPGWSEFEAGETTLALHATRDADDPRDLQPGRCRPGLRVASLEDFHARMLAAGVTCIQTPTVVFGAKVAQYQDPDGLIFSVGEGR